MEPFCFVNDVADRVRGIAFGKDVNIIGIGFWECLLNSDVKQLTVRTVYDGVDEDFCHEVEEIG